MSVAFCRGLVTVSCLSSRIGCTAVVQGRKRQEPSVLAVTLGGPKLSTAGHDRHCNSVLSVCECTVHPLSYPLLVAVALVA